MAETLDLQIVTPAGIALQKHVAEVTAPSVAGEFGVLPGHVPLLAALRSGIVTYKVGGEETKVAVANGFAQIVGDKALLLTEKFAKKEDVDVVATRARLKEVGDELSSWSGEHDSSERRDLIDEEQWLAAELELIGDPPPPTVREDTRFVKKDAVVVDTEPGPDGGPLPVTGDMHNGD
jgi:F-type H+-transporting ATPase subunit epsilon